MPKKDEGKQEKFLTGHLDYLKGSIYPNTSEIRDIKDLYVDLFHENLRHARENMDNWKEDMFPCKEGVFQNGHYTRMYKVPFIENLKIYTGYITGKTEKDVYLTKPEFEHCFIEMSGTGLQGYRDYSTAENPDFHLASRLLFDYDFKPTRVDACIDDFFQHFNLETVAKLVEKGYYGGSIRSTPEIIRSHNGGLTIYLGSRQSELMIRMYNKLAERQNKLFDYYSKEYAKYVMSQDFELGYRNNSEEYREELETYFYESSNDEKFGLMVQVDKLDGRFKTGVSVDVLKLETWQRYELQLKTEYALNFLRQMIGLEEVRDLDTGFEKKYENVAEIVLDYLKTRFKVLKTRDRKGNRVTQEHLKNNAHKNRLEVWKPWEKFVSNASCIDTSISVKEPSDLENSLFWKARQYGEIEQAYNWLKDRGIAPEFYADREMSMDGKMKVHDYIKKLGLPSEVEKQHISDLFGHDIEIRRLNP